MIPLIENNRSAIDKLCRRFHVARLEVFGSAVDGNFDVHRSDIDFLVKTGVVTSPWFPAGLIEDLERLLGRKVEVITENALHWYIQDKILQEAVPF